MIFRKSTSKNVPGVTETPAPEASRPGSKGRPTRSRREAEEARRRPLVPNDRKAARKQDRAAQAAARNRSQQALVSGDEANMPPQHRGRDRRLVRDVVDSRRNLAEIFFPVALVFMVLALVLPLINPSLYSVLSAAMVVVLWGGILLCVIDCFLLRRRLRRALTERFGGVESGRVGYGIMRAIQIRRWRLPRAQIKHGEQPR